MCQALCWKLGDRQNPAGSGLKFIQGEVYGPKDNSHGQCVLTGKMALVQSAVTLSDLPKEVVVSAIIYILIWRQTSIVRGSYRVWITYSESD